MFRIKYIILTIITFVQYIYACTNCYIPIAHAGDDATYFVGCTATLDGSLSYDLDFIDEKNYSCHRYNSASRQSPHAPAWFFIVQ